MYSIQLLMMRFVNKEGCTLFTMLMMRFVNKKEYTLFTMLMLRFVIKETGSGLSSLWHEFTPDFVPQERLHLTLMIVAYHGFAPDFCNTKKFTFVSHCM